MKKIGLLALALLVGACTADSPVEPPIPADPVPAPQAIPENFLVDDALEVDPAYLTLLSGPGELAAGIYRYRTEDEDARLPTVDGFLIGEGPDGDVYVRRVTAVDVDGRVVTATTVEAFWQEVIVGGRYTVSVALDGSDPDVEIGARMGPSASLVPVANISEGFTASFDLCTPLGDVLPVPAVLRNFNLCSGIGACPSVNVFAPPPSPGPALSVVFCGSLTRLEPSIDLQVDGVIDVVLDIDPGTLIPFTPPSLTEVSMRGNPQIDATLGLGVGLDGSISMTFVPIGFSYTKKLGKFAKVELVIGPQINLSAQASTNIDFAVDVDGTTNFVSGWRNGGLFNFSQTTTAQPSFQVTSRQLTMKGLVGIGVGATVSGGDSTKFAKVEAGLEAGIGIGVGQVNSLPSPCTEADVPIPGLPGCVIDNWRRDRDVIWEWSAAAFFNYQFGRGIKGGASVGVTDGGGKILDLRDVFGRGDLVVDIDDQHPRPRPTQFIGYPYDTCGGSASQPGTTPCQADLLITRVIPGRFGQLGGVPKDQLDPVAEPVSAVPVTQAPPLSQSIATGAGLFSQLPPPADCVVDRNRVRTDCTLPAGLDHALWIRGVAPNCIVDGGIAGDGGSALDGNDFYKIVRLTADAAVTEPVHLSCGDTPVSFGSVEVSVTTLGQVLDPDGYTLEVDGSVAGALGLNDTLLLGGLVAQTVTLTLGDVASNCSVQGGPTRSVGVQANATQAVSFAVDCVDPAVLGDVTVTTVSSGTDIPGSYTVDVAGQQLPIGANETLTVATPVGQTDVTLIDVAANCAVAGPNPLTVTVGATPVAATFDISCKTGQAGSTNPVSGMISVLGIAQPGTSRSSSTNVLHIVGEVLDVESSGSLSGTGTLTRDYNLRSGDGPISGSTSLSVTYNGLTGVVDGSFTGVLARGQATLSLTGRGTGDLDGLVFRLDLAGPFDGPFSYTGSVQDPNAQGPP